MHSKPLGMSINSKKDRRIMKHLTWRIMLSLAVLAVLDNRSVLLADGSVPGAGGPASKHHEWRFDSSAESTPPEVALNVQPGARASIARGGLSTGWHEQRLALGIDKAGYWDLGRRGTIRLSVPGSDLTSSTVRHFTVEVCQWFDGGIYTDPVAVSVTGGRLIQAGQRDDALGLVIGNWVISQTQWEVPAGVSADNIMITAPAAGAIVDAVVVDEPMPTSNVTGGDFLVSLQRSTNAHQVILSWPAAFSGVTLESTTNLNDSQSWKAVDSQVETNASANTVTVTIGDAQGFFRIKR